MRRLETGADYEKSENRFEKKNHEIRISACFGGG